MKPTTVCARSFSSVTAFILGMFMVPACELDELTDGFGETPEDCLRCHAEDGPLVVRDEDVPKTMSSDMDHIRQGHARHRGANIDCDTCHRVPGDVGGVDHIDGLPAEVHFSGQAASGGVVPRWNADTKRCEGTYCHGGGIFGGTIKAPSFSDPEEILLECDSCHGSPPLSGAHEEHRRATIPCDACHLVPTTVFQEGHIDTAPADVVFGATAHLSGASPKWRPEIRTCEGTYCHGATLTSASATSPRFLPTITSSTACDSCHGFPPPDTHSDMFTDCYLCHASTVTPDNEIDHAAGNHINGRPD